MGFKIGDTIRGTVKSVYGVTNEKMTKALVIEARDETAVMDIKILEYPSALQYVGRVYTVLNSNKYFRSLSLSSSSDKKEIISIYRKGNKVIALNKITREKGVAKCSPEDEFDFDIGAELAFNRLMDKTTTLKEGADWFKKEIEENSENRKMRRLNEIAFESIEKRIPKKGIIPKENSPYRLCPNCKDVYLDDTSSFCGKCGQAIDWSDS